MQANSNKEKNMENIVSKASQLSLEFIKMTQKQNEKQDNFQVMKQLQALIKTDNFSLESMLSQFSSADEFLSSVGKELPENIYKIQDMFLVNQKSTEKVYNYECLFDLFEEESKSNSYSPNYSFVTTSIDEIIKDSEVYWRSLQIQKEDQINMNLETPQKLEKFFVTMLDEIKTANGSWFTNLHGQMKNCTNNNQKMEKIIYNYTTEDYQYINPMLVNKNPYNLRKMARYLHLLIYNYKHQIAGIKFLKQQELIRCTKIPSNILQLYATDSLIFFTSLTSTSLEEMAFFGNNNDPNCFSVIFKIRIRSNSFIHSGLSIDHLSQYKNEKEILLLPYIIFKISKMTKDINNKKCLIELDELDNRDLINKIIEPKVIKFGGGVQQVSKSELISLVNEKVFTLSSELQAGNKSLNDKKIEFNSTITQMIKQENLDGCTETLFGDLSVKHDITCSGIYDKEGLKKYFSNYGKGNPGDFSKSSEEDQNIIEMDPENSKPIQNILWIDDMIFEQSDTNNLIQEISKKNSNINFICKNKTEDGLNFLKSTVGKELLKHKNFRILQDNVRLNEPDKYFAGVNFVKGARSAGINTAIMIFTSDKNKAEANFKERNVSLENVYVTTSYQEVYKFIFG